MKFYYIILPGLLAVAGFFLGYHANGNDPISKTEKVFSGQSGRTVHSLVSGEPNDVYSAILLMPKSYLPMLRRFAKHKLTKGIKIIPAKIGWHADEMIALPKKPIFRNKSHPAKIGTVNQLPTHLAMETPTPEFSAKIRAAAFLAFLTSVKMSRFK